MKFAIITQLGLHEYHLSGDTTVGQLKDNSRRKFSIEPSDRVHLTYRARHLNDADSVSKVGLPEGATHILVVKPQCQ
jgi:hypothetical protein